MDEKSFNWSFRRLQLNLKFMSWLQSHTGQESFPNFKIISLSVYLDLLIEKLVDDEKYE